MYVSQDVLHVCLKLNQDDNFILLDTDSITSKIFLLREILSARDPTCIPGITVPCKLLRFTNEELNSLKPHKEGYVKIHCM